MALMTFVVKKKKRFQCNVQAVYSYYLSKNVQCCNLFNSTKKLILKSYISIEGDASGTSF